MTNTNNAHTLRLTDGNNEMQWLVMVGDPLNLDREWCESEDLANKFAQEALDDARKEGYAVQVYVLKCIRQNG